MGTDLHVLVEVSHNDQPWRPVHQMNQPMRAPRAYPLFALLGDSRNHSGRHEPIWQEPSVFGDANGTTYKVPGWWYHPDDGGHDRITPISEPRGVPDDASLTWKAFVAIWDARGATIDVTWLTPEDIINADWDQVIYSYGVITETEYLALLETGKTPEIQSMNAGGEGVLTVSEVEYAAGVRGKESTCIRTRWRSGTLRELHGDFLDAVRAMADKTPSASRLRFMLLFES